MKRTVYVVIDTEDPQLNGARVFTELRDAKSYERDLWRKSQLGVENWVVREAVLDVPLQKDDRLCHSCGGLDQKHAKGCVMLQPPPF